MNGKTLILFWTAGTWLLLLTRSGAAAEVKPIPVTGNIQWVYSYPEGQKLARGSGKPMLVVFRCER